MLRRSMMLALALALLAAACGGDDAAGDAPDCAVDQVDGDLSFYNWSEYIDPDLVSAFEAEYGVTVTQSFYDSNETMLAQIQAGGSDYDVIVPSDYMVGIMIADDLLLPFQKDALPNLVNLDPKFTDLPFDPAGDYSAPYQWGTTGLGVSLAVVGDDYEESWGLIFDPDMSAPYAGNISMLNDPRETMGAALKYLGYSLNETSDAALQEAADLIKAAKDRIAKFDSDLYTDDLISGEMVITHGFNGNYFLTFDENDAWDDFVYFVPQEGGTVWVDNMAIPSDADSPCSAHTFINYILEAENGAQLSNWNFYASPNEAAKAMIDEEILDDPAIFPPQEIVDKLEFIENTGDDEIKFTDYFTQAKS
jgi:spermidine/putrescine-binding protein